MKLRYKLEQLKEYRQKLEKIKEYKKNNGSIVTARDMKKYVFEFGIVPTPLYTKGIEYKQIVDARTIYANPKRKTKIKI